MRLITNDLSRQKLIQYIKDTKTSITMKLFQIGDASQPLENTAPPVATPVLTKTIGNDQMFYAVRKNQVSSKPAGSFEVVINSLEYYIKPTSSQGDTYMYNCLYITTLVHNVGTKYYDKVGLYVTGDFGEDSTEYLLSLGNNNRSYLVSHSDRQFNFLIKFDGGTI